MKYRPILLAICSLFTLAAICLAEEKLLTPDLSRIDDSKVWKLVNAHLKTSREDDRQVVRLDPIGGNTQGKSNNAFALLAGVSFEEGTIDVDLRGNGPDAGFLGIAFNVTDADYFEAVYFRPFNFKREGSIDHAVQYIAHPDFPWKKLRETKPGAYEHKVDPAPDPSKWFHARFEITRQKISVWVDDAKEPCLAVDRLAARKAATIGLWVDSQVGAFSNLKIRPKQ